MNDLKGKIVVVTGATSGIGTAIARAFAIEGASLLLTGRDQARGKAVLEGLAVDNAAFMAGDVTDPGFCQTLIDAAASRFGGLDVLVNNAGIIHRATAEDTTDSQWRDTMSVNVDAVFYLSRAAVPALKKRGGGNIVNIASDWGLSGGRRAAAYCVSKGAVVQLTRCMALDHASDGIRVNAICPGETDTPMLEREYAELGLSNAEGRVVSAADIPLGRIGSPEEIANTVVFMASESASFITGTAFLVDGGASA
ncbi:MAG: SDR family oxidoreductase [Rhodospirillaceae bacterium]|nr:SDR family oxidoreductase [Rhodospirillaceae bacterium]